jgi:thiol-disulfide isomerase/thioredoxin
MNKNVIISLVVVLILVVLSGFYISSKKTNDAEKMMVKEIPASVMVKETPDAMVNEKDNKYIEYVGPETLEIKDSKVVLFFYANWCPTCIPVDKEFKAMEEKIPEGVTVIRVNYNDPDTDSNEKELSKKYGITYQHTFVQIDADGNEITKWNGGAIDELLSNIK